MGNLNRGKRAAAVVMGMVLAVLASNVAELKAALPAGAATAPASQSFTIKKQYTNETGAISTIGNTVLTCGTAASCVNAQNGTANANNSDFNMVNLDLDGIAGTKNSTSASLNLPATASVLWAGLYWGGRLDAGGTGSTAGNAAAINTIQFRTPKDGNTYENISASVASHDQFGPDTANSGAYQRFAEVTAQVQAAGNGTYWGANVETANNVKDSTGGWGGWALVIIYHDSTLPPRNLTVFDGFAAVSSGNAQSVTVSGFLAPKQGSVVSGISMVAYEGDQNIPGDFTRLNTTQLTTAVSPGTNFFNSTINALQADGSSANNTNRNPNYKNNLGFDIKNLQVAGAIPNGATSATFTFSSTQDLYFPGVLGLAINLYQPDFSTSTKTCTNKSGNSCTSATNNPARPGDTLTYVLNYANTGQDAANQVVSTDPLPAYVDYIPGSLRLVNPATSETIMQLTDGNGDDQGEYTAATKTVTVRLGTGADAANGGTINCSASGCAPIANTPTAAAYAFDVVLRTPDAGGQTIVNNATMAYTSQTTGDAGKHGPMSVTTPVADVADVAIVKTLSPNPGIVGGQVTATLKVNNYGPTEAPNTIVTDAIPAGWAVSSINTTAGSCTPTSYPVNNPNQIVCNLGTMGINGSATITIVGTVTSTGTSLHNSASVNSTAIDPNTANNTSADTITLRTQVDLGVTKQADAGQAAGPGGTVTWTATVTNHGPSDAVNVRVQDVLQDQTQGQVTEATITLGNSFTKCPVSGGIASCPALPLLKSGEQATVNVTSVLASSVPAGAKVTNLINVDSDTDEANPQQFPNNAWADYQVGTPVSTIVSQKVVSAPSTVVAGGPIVWQITTTNQGPADAAAVTVEDTVPAGVTLTATLNSRGTCTPASGPAGTIVSCNAGPLAAGTATTITLIGRVDAGYNATNLTNTATVTSPNDPNPNSPSVEVPVNPLFDLVVSKSANRTAQPGSVGAPVNYTIRVTNSAAGPSVARNITATDDVPAGLSVVEPVTYVLPDGVSANVACGTEGNLVTCSIDQLAPGEYVDIQVNTVSNGDLCGIEDDEAATCTLPPLTNTAEASAPGEDPTKLGNNTATWTLNGVPEPDLQLQKQGPATVTAGDNGQYTFTLTNLNSSDPENYVIAANPTVVDTLPEGVNWDGQPPAFTGNGTVNCDPQEGRTLTCHYVANESVGLVPGESASYTIGVNFSADLPDQTHLVNTATATLGDGDIDPALNNNTATWPTDVNAIADVWSELNITMADTDGSAQQCSASQYAGAGSQRMINVALHNDGPSAAQGASFRIDRTVAATANLSDMQISTDGGASWTQMDATQCTTGATEIECPLPGPGTIAAGGTVQIKYPITVSSSAPAGTYPDTLVVNAATRESTDPAEPTGAHPNNSAAPIEVCAPQSALQVTKNALNTVPNPWVAGAVVPPQPGQTAADAIANPSFVAGGRFTYQILVSTPTNGGSYADVVNGTLADTLPQGLLADSVSVSQNAPASCSITPGESPVTATSAPSSVNCEGLTVLGTNGTGNPPAIVITVSGSVDPDANNLPVYPDGDNYASNVPNTATANGSTPDGTAVAEAQGSTNVDIIEQADLGITKTLDPNDEVMYAGGSVGYDLTVTNNGPSGVEHAVVTDKLPNGFTVDLTDPANAACVAPTGVNTQAIPAQADSDLACFIGVLGFGQTKTIHLVARTKFDVDPVNYPNGAVNTATVGSLAYDPYWSATDADLPLGLNNTALVTVPVQRLTDVSVSAQANQQLLTGGDYVTLNAQVANAGPSVSVNTVGQTVLPAGFIPSAINTPYNTCTWSVTGTAPSWAPQPGDTVKGGVWAASAKYPTNYHYDPNLQYTLNCVPEFGPTQAWEPGGRATNSITVFVPSDTPNGAANGNGQPYTATTSIGTDTPETNITNNQDTLGFTVQAVSDTSITKNPISQAAPVAGQPYTWRLSVTNHGPSVARGTLVADSLPAHMSYSSAYPAIIEHTDDAAIADGTKCQFPDEAADGGLVQGCRVGDLGVGESATVLVTFIVDGDVMGFKPVPQICNAAIVGSLSLDPDAGSGLPDGVSGGADAGNNQSQTVCATPVAPAVPAQPVVPAQPEIPTQPVEPAQPQVPAKPAVPVAPVTPAPVKPVPPVTPAPVWPEKPGPGGADGPDGPAPVKPATPATPAPLWPEPPGPGGADGPDGPAPSQPATTLPKVPVANAPAKPIAMPSAPAAPAAPQIPAAMPAAAQPVAQRVMSHTGVNVALLLVATSALAAAAVLLTRRHSA